MPNPRKFSEKIALHTQKQAEGTAAYEAILKEVSATTGGLVGKTVENSRSGVKFDQKKNQEALEKQQPQLAGQQQQQKLQRSSGSHLQLILPSLSQRGRSLPNVNQATDGTIDLANALCNLRDIERSVSGERLNDQRKETCQPIKARRHTTNKSRDCSPYGSIYLSLPNDPSWRRTSSDSALHSSLQATLLGQNVVTEQGQPSAANANYLHLIGGVGADMTHVLDNTALTDLSNGQRSMSGKIRPRSCAVTAIKSQEKQKNEGTLELPATVVNTGSLPNLATLNFLPLSNGSVNYTQQQQQQQLWLSISQASAAVVQQQGCNSQQTMGITPVSLKNGCSVSDVKCPPAYVSVCSPSMHGGVGSTQAQASTPLSPPPMITLTDSSRAGRMEVLFSDSDLPDYMMTPGSASQLDTPREWPFMRGAAFNLSESITDDALENQNRSVTPLCKKSNSNSSCNGNDFGLTSSSNTTMNSTVVQSMTDDNKKTLSETLQMSTHAGFSAMSSVCSKPLVVSRLASTSVTPSMNLARNGSSVPNDVEAGIGHEIKYSTAGRGLLPSYYINGDQSSLGNGQQQQLHQLQNMDQQQAALLQERFQQFNMSVKQLSGGGIVNHGPVVSNIPQHQPHVNTSQQSHQQSNITVPGLYYISPSTSSGMYHNGVTNGSTGSNTGTDTGTDISDLVVNGSSQGRVSSYNQMNQGVFDGSGQRLDRVSQAQVQPLHQYYMTASQADPNSSQMFAEFYHQPGSVEQMMNEATHMSSVNNCIPDIVLTAEEMSFYTNSLYTNSSSGEKNFEHTESSSNAMGEAVPSPMILLGESFDLDLLTDDALRLGPLDLDELQMLSDPGLITDPSIEDSFKLESLTD